MNYKTSMDGFVKIISILYIIIMASIFYSQLDYFKTGNGNLFIYSSSFILFIAFCFALFFKPNSYTITPTQIIINRFIGKKYWERNEITIVQKITKQEMGFTFRSFGVGGLFGYFGKFYSTKFGLLNYFATNRNNLVYIKFQNHKKYIISPDDVDGFVENLINK